MTKPGFWAVVPAKDLAQAKQRLAAVLTLEERQGLACAMLRDVLAALSGADGLAGTLVVTRDADLAGIAQEYGARIMADLRHEGPSAAVTLAATKLAGEGAHGMLAIPADVPLASAEEIGEIIATAGAAPSVTLVPALADMGSNAVALAPADAIPLRFGTRSFFLHQEAALGRGIEPRILRLPGLGLDLDRPEDLRSFMAERSHTRSFAYLSQCDIMARLTAFNRTLKNGAQ
jgi:2-phospho-L-lactate/phosphoenolpyruvate guanylyltransferase